MIRLSILATILGISLSGCIVQSLERNKQAVDCSTCSIMENTRAIEQANDNISENSRRLKEINEVLQHVGGE